MEERPFVRNGKTLLSGIDPAGRADKIAEAVTVKDRTLYFCPSPLYGYGLARLLTRLETDAPNSAILCVEADRELFELSEKNITRSLFAGNKLRITNLSERTELCSFVRETWGGRAFRRIEVIRFSGGWQLFSQIYDSLFETLRREIATDWSNALTLTKLGRLYIRNAIRNLALLPYFPSIENLSFAGAPVLVLGAGPSLDEILDALVKHFSSLLNSKELPFKIICVDTCLGSLKDRGIIPDLAVVLESQHWNLRDFIGCKGWNVAAAIDLSSLPASAKLLAGKGFLFFTPWTSLRIFERLKKAKLLPAVIPPLGSVGLCAVELCRRLTKGKIICAGLDFSFTFDKYHARSATGHRSRLNSQTRLRGLCNVSHGAFAASSKSGFSVYTNPAMENYRNLFQREFSGDAQAASSRRIESTSISTPTEGRHERLFDIEGSGLSLGVKTLSMDEAMDVLRNDSGKNHHRASQGNIEKLNDKLSECDSGADKDIEHPAGAAQVLKEKVLLFLGNEKSRLLELRDILSGIVPAERGQLSALIDECDYLWAHFPDYACKDGQGVNLSDISFLKRVRAEIDPMVRLLESSLNNLISA